MPYTTEELEEIALKAIEEHKTPFHSHLISHMPISMATFYNHKLEELESIKTALNKVRTEKKTKILDKMSSSDSASAQIAAYKLLSDDHEFSKLSGQQIDHTSKGEKVQGFNIVPPDDNTD